MHKTKKTRINKKTIDNVSSQNTATADKSFSKLWKKNKKFTALSFVQVTTMKPVSQITLKRKLNHF